MADEQIYLHLSYICRISNLDSGKVGCGLAAVKTFRSNLISAAEVEADLKNASWPSSGQRLLYRVIDFELDDMLDDSEVLVGESMIHHRSLGVSKWPEGKPTPQTRPPTRQIRRLMQLYARD